MSILGIIAIIAVIGFLLWWVETYVPMDAGIKKILQGIVILILVLWILQMFGVFGGTGLGHIGVTDNVRL